ncbi:MAG: hypothetical protein K2P84_09275 [Undibacterium sp.]|nr:hypothetical protein [Undibacterium sp.]
MPLRAPPEGSCVADESAAMSQGAPHIVSPLRGVTHIQRMGQASPLLLKAELASGTSRGNLHWFVDDTSLGLSKVGQTLNWQPPHAGRYLLRVVDDGGLTDSRVVVVEGVQ